MSELPQGWALPTLCEVADWGSGGTPSRTHPEYYGGDIPWIKTGELGQGLITDTEEKITELGLRNSSAKLFPKNSVAIAMYGATIGKTSILGIDATTNQACAVGIPKDGVLSTEYLFHYLSSQKDAFIDAGKGGAQPNISQGVIKEWPILLAPCNEQKRIADKLDQLLTAVNSCKTRLDTIPGIIKRFRQSVLASATSGELTKDFHVDASEYIQMVSVEEPYFHKITAPSTWKQTTLGDVCEFVGGSQPPKSTFQSEAGTGLIRLIQIRDYKSDRYLTYIPISLARRFCTKDDVMIGRYGPPIFQILRGLEGAYNVALMKAVPRTEALNREYLYYFLQGEQLLRFVESGSDRTAGQDGVRKELVNRYPFFLPSYNEQREIVRRVEALFAVAERLEARYQAARAQVDQLTPSLLAKAFRGELVPQDPNDEPAEKLLERIKAGRACSQQKAAPLRRGRKKLEVPNITVQLRK